MSADFIDTNVIVYVFDAAFPEKQIIAKRIVVEAIAKGNGVISFQVVQESMNTLSRKFKTKITDDDAAAILDDVLLPLMQVMPSADLYREALRIGKRYRLSYYDALIVSAALSAGCSTLVSEDLQHGQIIEGLRIKNPFLNKQH